MACGAGFRRHRNVSGEQNVLKKTGVVLSIATAGLLAMSPLAFAGESEHHYDDEGHRSSHHFDRDQRNSVEGTTTQVGMVNISGVESNVQTQTCGNGMANTAGATATATSAVSDLATPLDPVLSALLPLPQGTEISASGALADAANPTIVTCSLTGGTQDSISQSNDA
jgi:uncharacterized protein (DUF1501 family)